LEFSSAFSMVHRLHTECRLTPALLLHPDAQEALEHCRHSLSQEALSPADDSQSGRSSTAHRCCADSLLSHGNFDRSSGAPAVALSQVWRAHGCRRTIHSGTTPTPFSTVPGHGYMKSLAYTLHCRRSSERLAEGSLGYIQISFSSPRLGSLRPSTRLCTAVPAATPPALTTLANFYTLAGSIQFA
jgi:hypothetical protein